MSMGYITGLKFVRLTFDVRDSDEEVLLFPANGSEGVWPDGERGPKTNSRLKQEQHNES